MEKLFTLVFFITANCLFSADSANKNDVLFKLELLNKKKSQVTKFQTILNDLKDDLSLSAPLISSRLHMQAEEFQIGMNGRTKDVQKAVYLFLISTKLGHRISKQNIQAVYEDPHEIKQDRFNELVKKYHKKSRNKNITEEDELELKALIIILFAPEVLIDQAIIVKQMPTT
jgi:hypothetical protein